MITIILLILLGLVLCFGIVLIARIEDECDGKCRILMRVRIGMSIVLIMTYTITLLHTIHTLLAWVFCGDLIIR